MEEKDSASDNDLEEMEENKEETDPAQNHGQGQKRKQAEVKNLVQSRCTSCCITTDFIPPNTSFA